MRLDHSDANTSSVASDRVLVDYHIKSLKYVIFPNNRWIQVWDLFLIFTTWYYAFAVPFSFGVSRGYFQAVSLGVWIFNIILNIGFFGKVVLSIAGAFLLNYQLFTLSIVDSFLPFFRPYRDKHGRLVTSLKKIRRHYIRSGLFFINLLASLPGSETFGYMTAQRMLMKGESYEDEMIPLNFISVFKLLRLFRIRRLMDHSYVLSRIWERIDIDHALFVYFLLLITLIAHWIGCIWCWIAYLNVGSFSSESLLGSANWISNWYESNYVEGGLDPLGWENCMSRYFLALFWAVQSITSIGYGNIQPVTLAEYVFANALMLVCGIFWAYIIGKLVEVVAVKGDVKMGFTSRMNEANQMIRAFVEKDLPESVIGTVHNNSSTRVRRFISDQRENATKSWLDSNNSCSLHDAYPTLRILSPELQRVCALHLAHSLLETIPYLSSKYLCPQEQAGVILQCVTMEFSTGETFLEHPDLGRGCFLFRHGDGCIATLSKSFHQGPVNANEVLVDDALFKEHPMACHFVGFSKVLFLPRSVIIAVLEKHERAWKECARWKYFMATFMLHSLSKSSKTSEKFPFS